MSNQGNNVALRSRIASELLRIKAIKLSPNEPFKWSSGWNSPIYCDNRMTLSYPDLRTMIKNAFVQDIKLRYPEAEVIAGVATAGIPQGAIIAEAMNLPFIYVRDKAKSHGMTNRIEGRIQEGKNVVVIEDLISTGGSSIRAIEALREANMKVLGLGAIFTYGFPDADKNLSEAEVDYFTLSGYDVLLDIAKQENYIEEEAKASLEAWRKDPANWNA
ncbi:MULTISPECIES: orotate phosphoribosyltransferase [Reichenbachiella]|uniref:Orotate phosphoribosyltransferase n=1 Tax=Reichenbachiella agariperforans TaxID=156994 RepID=A0A1M6SQN8_REIAG|nr:MULTISPECIES: orotate phosphoribosyltransferase [Reichenbachiella]MBU2916229.1 orotate phosphoribosyltransferase [Reichenbachiella agariperforans]RJE75081.1 orotate phosphoribosyltransferase [Reichenbachiella sp. MSK19-1]SHK46959.1 orotate phosphoribosyltransferase [Reichenbachiella agariperforans]